MIISDKAKKIVEDFSIIPKNFKTSLTTQVAQIKQAFNDLNTGKTKDQQIMDTK